MDTDAANAINVEAAATAMGGVVVCLDEFSIARVCGRHSRIMTAYRSMRVCVYACSFLLCLGCGFVLERVGKAHRWYV